MKKLVTTSILALLCACGTTDADPPIVGVTGDSGVSSPDVEAAAPTCGNSLVEFGEICDDGNQTDGDGCSADCRPTPCNSTAACEHATLPPSAIKSEASDAFGKHHVFYPATLRVPDYLYVYLPGSSATPSGYMQTLETVAAQGIRTIGLAYSNKLSAFGACQDDSDVDCAEKLRAERIYGTDLSEVQDTPKADAIVPRLVALLNRLQQLNPAGQWDQFLRVDGSPRWEKMVIAGHSQGAGHAALIARDHLLARAIMYGGPFDVDQTQAVDAETKTFTPTWLADAHVTPAANYYGFIHQDDNKPHTFIALGNWDILGLPGQQVDVSLQPPPYTSHRLITTQLSGNPHGDVKLQHYAHVHAQLCCEGLPE